MLVLLGAASCPGTSIAMFGPSMGFEGDAAGVGKGPVGVGGSLPLAVADGSDAFRGSTGNMGRPGLSVSTSSSRTLKHHSSRCQRNLKQIATWPLKCSRHLLRQVTDSYGRYDQCGVLCNARACQLKLGLVCSSSLPLGLALPLTFAFLLFLLFLWVLGLHVRDCCNWQLGLHDEIKPI